MTTKVSVGITTVIGWLVAAGGALPIVVKLLEQGRADLHGPEAAAAIIGTVSLGVTQFGRYLQAHAKAKAAATATTPELPPVS